MSDRLDYFFRQKVTEAELDNGFDDLEAADRAIATDFGMFGLLTGQVMTEFSGTPNLTVDVSAGQAYDQTGQRVVVPSTQNVDVSVDSDSNSTTVAGGGNAKIVSVYAKFDRALSDPRTDGNSLTVFFERNESFQFIIRQGAEATSGAEVAPALEADAILLGDITLLFGTTQVFNGDIDFVRRQRIFALTAGTESIDTTDIPLAFTAVLQAISDVVAGVVDAADVTNTPAGNIAAADVQAALNELDTEKGGLAEVETWTAAQTFDDITASGVTRYKLTSRSLTRVLHSTWMWEDGGAGASDWEYNLSGAVSPILTSNTALSRFALLPLDLPNGCTITDLTCTVVGAGAHGGLPASLPVVRILKQAHTTGTPSVVSTTTDPSGSVGAYEVLHDFGPTGLSEVVTKDTHIYFAEIENESSTNALAGFRVFSVDVTFTITSMDDGAG